MIPAATAGEAHVSRCLDCRLIPYMQSPGQLSEDLREAGRGDNNLEGDDNNLEAASKSSR